jgi:hypothetical protein
VSVLKSGQCARPTGGTRRGWRKPVWMLIIPLTFFTPPQKTHHTLALQPKDKKVSSHFYQSHVMLGMCVLLWYIYNKKEASDGR